MSTQPLPIFSRDQDLYDALRRRDERAYQLLYSESLPPFRYWVITNSGTAMDAEDAFQKGLLNFLLNLETGQYQYQPETRVTTVLFEYCKRVWFTELKSARVRRRGTLPEGYEAADTDDVQRDLERADVIRAVRASLHQLKGECRNLIEWFYVDELSLREIAGRLGMKESSVKSKRYDCAEKLKTYYRQTAINQGL